MPWHRWSPKSRPGSLRCFYLLQLLLWPFCSHLRFRPTSSGLHLPVTSLVSLVKLLLKSHFSKQSFWCDPLSLRKRITQDITVTCHTATAPLLRISRGHFVELCKPVISHKFFSVVDSVICVAVFVRLRSVEVIDCRLLIHALSTRMLLLRSRGISWSSLRAVVMSKALPYERFSAGMGLLV